jgi:hypothetical protein
MPKRLIQQSSNRTQASASDARLKMAGWFCDQLYGDRAGLVGAMIGRNPRAHGGSYKLDVSWEYHEWPESRGALSRRLVQLGEEADVYVGVLLRSRPDNHKEFTLPGRHCWADLDRPPSPEGHELLSALMSCEGCFSVSSGTRGGRHIYLGLDAAAAPSDLERFNERLARAVGADSGFACNKVLRVPGTFNYKPTVAKRPAAPAPVVVEGRDV